MQIIEEFMRLLSRFRYPVSLPEDIARDLGVCISNSLTFKELIKFLRSPHLRLCKVAKFMPRELAEDNFQSALKKESFKSSSLFSYYFNKGWLVFALYYDENDRLRRLHVQCPSCSCMEGFDIHLDEEPMFAKASSH
ncbi:MAG: hypothetical protein ACKVOH_03890 [Chlamydiales bacterium]